MTKIEALVEIINQSDINCRGINCRECPFSADPEQLCYPWGNETARREALKQMIIAAVDEARKEEVGQKPTTPSHTTPDHYKLTPEPIDVIKGWDLGFCLGNVIKYLARAGHKAGESRDKDLHKAMEYLRMELEDQADAKESTAARRCC